MLSVWNKSLSPLCEQPLCPSMTGYAWHLARTYHLKSFQPWSEKSLPEWFASIKRGTSMSPLFSILDHLKTRTHGLLPKTCWEETGLLTRNGAIFFARWQTNLKKIFFWAFVCSKSSTLKNELLKSKHPFIQSSPCCKSHSEASPEGLNSFKSIQGALAWPWCKSRKGRFWLWQLHVWFFHVATACVLVKKTPSRRQKHELKSTK